MEYAISAAVVLCFSIALLWAYRRGLKDGMAVSQGKPPEPIKSPVQAVREYKEAKAEQKQNDIITEGLSNILGYNGDPQEGGGK